MSEAARMWTEISFNVFYLIAVWGLVAAMTRRRSTVALRDRTVAERVRWAFFLLALGDTGHVGFRVLAYAAGNLDFGLTVLGQHIGLVGAGAMATAFTVTLFYVLMLYVWRARLGGEFGWFQYALLAAAAVRVGLMLLPGNQWNSVVPPQPWSIYRNLPLMLLGLGVAYLILRDARTAPDRAFLWIGALILLSYACYMPVVFFVQRAPLLGMLMIPKTLAYLGIGLLAYRELYGAGAAAAATETSERLSRAHG
jgi:hypothetical protein